MDEKTEICKIMAEFGYSQARLARALDIPVRTVQNWSEGKSTPPKYVLALIRYYFKTKKEE